MTRRLFPLPTTVSTSGNLISALLCAVLLLPALAFAQTLSISPDSSFSTPSDSLYTIGFEEFEDGVPVGMSWELGATTGEDSISNQIARDTVVFRSGESSVRISGGDSTTNWYALSVDIPDSVSRVAARLWVKSEDLHAAGNQFDNLHAGFMYDGLLGAGSGTITRIPEDSSDWTEITVFLDTEINLARDISFILFSSVSGTLWVDDLTLLADEQCDGLEPEGPAEALSDYIGDLSRPTTFMEMAEPTQLDCPDSLTAQQALEDAETFFYIFENGYSGYHYWTGHGVDFEAAFDSVEALAAGGGKVAVADMEQAMAAALSEVQDGHLRITGHSRHSFLQRKSPYFADVIVERTSDADGVAEYTVVQSLAEGVEPGMVYRGPEERLFRIPSKRGVQQFQLGVFSDTYTTRAPFSFYAGPGSESAAAIMLPLHECRLARAEEEPGPVFSAGEIDGIDAVRVSSFGYSQDSVLQEFVALGENLADEDRLIVNLMGNGGGSSVYPRDFVKNLNGTAQWRMYYAVLCSPATIGAAAGLPVSGGMPAHIAEYVGQMRDVLDRLREQPVRTWLRVTREIAPREMGDYQGRAVFLIDRGVASSGEAFADYTKSIPGAVLVGENSGGVGTFGEVRTYWLPNSHIRLNVPSKLFLMPDFQEGVGYIPDYWLDSSNPVQEVADWLNHPESYQFQLEEVEPEMLRDLSFDEFVEGVPQHMRASIGARSGNGRRTSVISRDTTTKVEGSASLRIHGDAETDHWYSVGCDMPRNLDSLTVTYSVRGDSIRQEGNQFDNCYVGFICKDANGSREFVTNHYQGSFDWQRDTLRLDAAELGAVEVHFLIFQSMSGTLWVDDVRFQESERRSG